MRFAHSQGVSPLQETEIFRTPAEFSPGNWEATQPLQILRRSRGIGCQNEFSKLQRITGSIVLGCDDVAAVPRGEKEDRDAKRESGAGVRDTWTRQEEQAIRRRDLIGSNPCARWTPRRRVRVGGRGPGVHVVTSSRAWQVLQAPPPPMSSFSRHVVHVMR